MHAGEINLHRLINADRALDRQLRAPAPPPPSFCVGNLQRRQTAFSCKEGGESERQERRERRKDRGASAEEKEGGEVGSGGGGAGVEGVKRWL